MERFPGNSHALLIIGPWSPGALCWQPLTFPCCCFYPSDFCMSERSPPFGHGSSSLPFSSLLLAWSFHSENKLMARKEESPDSTWTDLLRIWSSETCAGLCRRSLVVPCSYLECADLRTKLNLFLGPNLDSNQIQLLLQQWGSVILEEKGW